MKRITNCRFFPMVLAILFAGGLVSGLASCSKESLNQRMSQIQKEISEVEIKGAKVCAPKEYAGAESHLAFARDDWFERSYISCSDHLGVAEENLAAARGFLGNCVELMPPDSDGDGILNDQDQCPDQPEDFDQFEDQDGCPDPDNDGDGILDVDDQCPNEAEVYNGIDDEDGCPDYQFVEVGDNEIVLKQKIHFESGKAVIAPQSYGILDEIVSILSQNLAWKISVEGHTDSRGNPTRNIQLSQSRADACRGYLLERGIEEPRLSASGFGPSQPIAPNQTEIGRAMNRRVEFKIIEK